LHVGFFTVFAELRDNAGSTVRPAVLQTRSDMTAALIETATPHGAFRVIAIIRPREKKCTIHASIAVANFVSDSNIDYNTRNA
jgi:hypothetical protein